MLNRRVLSLLCDELYLGALHAVKLDLELSQQDCEDFLDDGVGTRAHLLEDSVDEALDVLCVLVRKEDSRRVITADLLDESVELQHNFNLYLFNVACV